MGDIRLDLRNIVVKRRPPRRDVAMLRILDDVSLVVRGASLHCAAGRSGSGKTTLLDVAAGLLEPTSGQVVWNDTTITTMADNDRSRLRRRFMGYVAQDAGLINSLTAEENVLLAAVPDRLAGRYRDRALDLLGQLGLVDRLRHVPSQLSGGERQRVALARALLLDPPLLVVDEPTAGIDRSGADEIIEMLRRIASRDGRAILVASHDQHLIAAADDVTTLE